MIKFRVAIPARLMIVSSVVILMSTRLIRFWLWSAAAVLAASGAGGFVYLESAPLETPGALNHAPPAPATVPAVNNRDAPVPAALESLWSLDLRRPLYDPVPVPVEAPSPLPLKVKLAGTIIEPGHSKAILSAADGKTELRGVGEKSGDLEVIAIERDSVTVLYNGIQIVLKPSGGKAPR